jgi:hypothetical protein
MSVVEEPARPPVQEHDLRFWVQLFDLHYGLFLRALRHLLTAEVLDNRGLLSFFCGVKHPSITNHSQLVFEFEVTMFWGDMGCTLSAFAGACVGVEILIPLCCCRLQSICQCLIDMDQRYEGVGHFKSRRSVCCARNR